LGNEGKGLSGKILDLADTVFKIPFNTKSAESLNVAAAGAICMYLINK
jgi:tRNA G18 (ribose-2'-O)-methylase SpoU